MNRKPILLTTLFILFALLLSACAANEAGRAESAVAPAAEPAFDTAESGESGALGGDFDDAAFAEEEMMEDTVTADGTAANQAPLTQERLIIRTANLSLVVTDTEEALGRITQMAEENGGWVVNSSVYQYNENAKTGNITIRVPSEGFSSAMEALKAMAVEVRSESTSGQDVTEDYVDLSSRLENLEATAARVRNFLDEAQTVEEALAVNSELSRLESEIEVIKGRMQYLSQSASFSTITIDLTPDELSQPIEVGGWQPEGIAREAVEALVDALQSVATFLIWVGIYVLPLVILVILPLWLVGRFIWRRWRQRTAEAPAPQAGE